MSESSPSEVPTSPAGSSKAPSEAGDALKRAIPKPSGLKPPSSSSTAMTSSMSSGIHQPSKIGRLCAGHPPKAGPPPAEPKRE